LTKKKEKKREKKEKRKPFNRRGDGVCQCFLEKYYPTKEVWRFLQKPAGLDIDKPYRLVLCAPRLTCFPFLFFKIPNIF